MSRTYRIRHLPKLNIAKHFAWSTSKFIAYHGRRDMPDNLPILPPYWHPWVRHSSNTAANVFFRKLAHQQIRGRTKWLLNKSGQDYDSMVLPAWYEYFDRWSFD